MGEFSFIYFRNDSDSVHTTVETARKAIREQDVPFSRSRSRAAVPWHRNCAEIGVLCVNCGPILLLCQHGYETYQHVNSERKNRIICIMHKCLNPCLNDRNIWTQNSAILLRGNVANGFA